METTESNKLIAKFMDFDFENETRLVINYEMESLTEEERVFQVEDLKYHSSWDWLMPVAIKCHEAGAELEKKYPIEKNLNDNTGWRYWSYLRVDLSTNILDTYNSVLIFIDAHNRQSK